MSKHKLPPTGEEVGRALWEPLLRLLTPEQRTQAEAMGRDPETAPGMLAWGVRSRYCYWVRHHPGETPTPDLILQWMGYL